MYREVFNKAGEKIDFLEAILRERPDLRGIEPQYPPQGQKGYIIVIGNEVFKAPKNINPAGEPFQDYKTELEYLTALQDKGLPVPKITTMGKDYQFFGMTLIEGERLPYNLPAEQRKQFVKDLIDFVINMANALPTRDGKFANHDDLWHSNIMIDPETKRLNGVIDFGKVKYITADQWEPMYDFAGSAYFQELQDEFDRRRGDLPGAAPKKSIAAKAKTALGMTASI